MHNGRKLLLTLLMLTFGSLVACTGGIAELYSGNSYEQAQERLTAALSQLPTPPGTITLDQYQAGTGGQLDQCAGKVIGILKGTNNLNLQEVFEFYSASLSEQGWKQDLASTHGRSFAKGNVLSLSVSDLYTVSPFKRTAIEGGKKQFRTLFMIDLRTNVTNPVPEACQGQ